MKKTFKKVMSVVLTAAIVVSGVSVAGKKADAKGAKKYNTRMYVMEESGNWISGDDCANGLVKKSISIAKGKKVHVELTAKNNAKKTNVKNIKKVGVLTVDVEGLLKDYKVKKCKYSNVTVKCDGKAVKGYKLVQGYFEPDQKNNNFRLALYNQYGSNGDNSAKVNKASTFKFKKSISVSFDVVAK